MSLLRPGVIKQHKPNQTYFRIFTQYLDSSLSHNNCFRVQEKVSISLDKMQFITVNDK